MSSYVFDAFADYIVQGHRFNILEDVGCLPEIFNTPPAYPLVFMWPVLLGCISFVYASLTLRSFWIRRAQFNQLLATNKAMTTSRYFRLMLLSCAEMACTIPLGAYSIYINTAGVQLAPWVSWSNAHYDFSRVVEVPAVVWTSERSYLISVEMGRWIYPFSAFLFFSLFGFAKEAQRNYRLAFNWIVKLFGRKPSKAEAPVISFIRFRNPLKASRALSEDTLPQYSPPTRMKRVDSLSSFLAGGPGGADLEKDVPLGKPPMTQSETSTVTSIERDTGHPIIISDAYPASRPPSPHIISYPEPAAIPSFHRPFSPPTIYPVSPTHAAASDSSIQVNIQTEAVQSV
ncbi:hypothetical protein AcV7_010119 [Taiwanofungus camphoratus]|nr:hypothetical protein AcV7_010119 [Antrodia cinnamomea]